MCKTRSGLMKCLEIVIKEVFKEVIKDVVKVLVHLINRSLSSGTFPDVLKKAIVKPLYKKSDRQNPTNYRPIALLSIFSKILEKVVKERLVAFMTKNKFFSKNQYGFQRGVSTDGALLDLMIKVNDSLNEGSVCAGIFVDIMKAFDTVDHSLLLTRMYEAGVRGMPLNWFRTYLSGRTQHTKVNQSLSKSGVIEFGIPQGSVLSGPLFLIYVNELCNGTFKGHLIAFADDTALFYKSNSTEQLQADMQADLLSLRWWFTNSFMIMSPKTKYVIFNLSRNLSFHSQLKYHNLACVEDTNCSCPTIEQVDEIKYLGLYLDSKVNWKTHVGYVKNKLVKYIRVFYLLKTICDSKLLKTIYYALINSKLEYGLAVWGGTYQSTLKPLILIQKRFIRIISKRARLEHTLPLFRQQLILPLNNLYIYKVLRAFFERSGNRNENAGTKRGTLRNRSGVNVPKPKRSQFMKSYSYLAPKFFNVLPVKLKECEMKYGFLKGLKNLLLESDDVSVFFRILK